jgi:hypothetical protein
MTIASTSTATPTVTAATPVSLSPTVAAIPDQNAIYDQALAAMQTNPNDQLQGLGTGQMMAMMQQDPNYAAGMSLAASQAGGANQAVGGATTTAQPGLGVSQYLASGGASG